ncbi:DUF1656 domain-containing protein [Xanthobacteraceae bacterium A53D]
MGEIDLYGVFVPTLLPLAILAYGGLALIRRGLQHFGAYRFVWHRAFFDVCLYVLVLGGLVALATQWSMT